MYVLLLTRRATGLADIACHVIVCHSLTHEVSTCVSGVNDVAGLGFRV